MTFLCVQTFFEALFFPDIGILLSNVQKNKRNWEKYCNCLEYLCQITSWFEKITIIAHWPTKREAMRWPENVQIITKWKNQLKIDQRGYIFTVVSEVETNSTIPEILIQVIIIAPSWVRSFSISALFCLLEYHIIKKKKWKKFHVPKTCIKR